MTNLSPNEERRTNALYAAALFLSGRGVNATQVIDTAQAFERWLRSGDAPR